MSVSHIPYLAPFKSGDARARIRMCRQRADELRLIADDVMDDNCRVTLLRLAQSYERMAGNVEMASREQNLQLS
jgi:hypothetical protein